MTTSSPDEKEPGGPREPVLQWCLLASPGGPTRHENPPTHPMAHVPFQPNWVTYKPQRIHNNPNTRVMLCGLSITKAAYLILKTSGQKARYQCTMSPFLQGVWIRIPWVLLKPLSLGLKKESELPPVPFGVMVGIHSTTTAFFNNPAYIPLMKMKSFYSYGTTYIFVWHLTSVCHSYWISVSQLETSKL